MIRHDCHTFTDWSNTFALFSWLVQLPREVAPRGPPPLSRLPVHKEAVHLASIFHKLIWVRVEEEEGDSQGEDL